jgi:hypothetical protein
MYLIDFCPCCASKELRRWPAIVSPFIANYACGAFRIKLDKIPPLGLQKCGEHLNFFNEPSLEALLKSEGLRLLESGVVAFDGGKAGNRTILNRILYGLAQIA